MKKNYLIIFFVLLILDQIYCNDSEVIQYILQELAPLCPVVCYQCPKNVAEKIDQPVIHINKIKIFLEIPNNNYCAWISFVSLCDVNTEKINLKSIWLKSSMPLIIVLENKNLSSSCSNVPRIYVTKDKSNMNFLFYAWWSNDLRLINIWNNNKGFFMDNLKEQLIKLSMYPRSSIQGKNLTISVTGTTPYVKYDSYGNIVGGVDFDILSILSKAFEFDFHLKKEQTWLSINEETKQMSGIVASVYEKKSDIGIGHISIRHDRYQLIDYTTVMYPIATYLVAKKPSPNKPIYNIMKPFTFRTWTIIALSFVILSYLFKFDSYFNNLSNSYMDFKLISFAIMTGQTIRDSYFLSRYSKLLLILFLLCGNFLQMAYKSNLRANLMVIDYEKPIETIQDVLDQQRQLFIPKGTVVEKDFATSPIPILQKAYQEASVKKNGSFIFDQGWAPLYVEKSMLVNGSVMVWPTPIVNHDHLGSIMKIYRYDPFRISNTEIQEIYTAFVVQKNSPWLKSINKATNWLRDAGIIQRLVEIELDEESNSSSKDHLEMISFTMDHFLISFIIIILGNIVALISFLYEKRFDWIFDFEEKVNFPQFFYQTY